MKQFTSKELIKILFSSVFSFLIFAGMLVHQGYASYRECTNSGSGCQQVCGINHFADVTANANGTYTCSCAGPCGPTTAGQSCGNNASGTCTPNGNSSCGKGGVCGSLYCCGGNAVGSTKTTKTGTTSSGSNSGSSNGGTAATTTNSTTKTVPVTPPATGFLCQCSGNNFFTCTSAQGTSTYNCTNILSNSQCILNGVTQMNTIGEKPTCGTASTSSFDTPDHICNGVSAGGYCGSVLPGGSSDTLYQCDGSGIDPTSQKTCHKASGSTYSALCVVNPPGKADCCQDDPSCSFANSTAATVLAYNANDSAQAQVLLAKVLAARALVLADQVKYDAKTNTFFNPTYKVANIPAGPYILILHIDGYLDKQLTKTGSAFTMVQGQATMPVGPVEMTIGDVAPRPHGDNVIDIQDYNAVLSCVGQTKPSATCPDPTKMDFHKDGVIDQKDVDMIKANFNKHGDIPVPAQFTCVTDPSCISGKGSMQACTLKCSLSQ
ncbi:MAG TPA: hypothetical protein VLF89_02235 [Candidatus Saccharimonadales bacterium]|nr:hypothetical protein [Candidatus Saccharimonadales bacterium]